MRLRPLRIDDEAAARAANEAMRADDYPFLLFYDPERRWADHLRVLERFHRGQRLPNGMVPSTFLVAVVDGEIVGRASIRHRLNRNLERDGGHIGYAVLPPHRRRGHATAILRQSLVVLRSYGVDDALLTCDEGNLASAAVIERCGGELDSVITLASGERNRRYWIR